MINSFKVNLTATLLKQCLHNNCMIGSHFCEKTCNHYKGQDKPDANGDSIIFCEVLAPQQGSELMEKLSEGNKKMRMYIIGCIDASDRDLERLPETSGEKLQFLSDTFISEYGYNIKRYGLQGAICEYLKGLPSAINTAYMDNDILILARDWGWIEAGASEAREDRIIAKFFPQLANAIIKLWRDNKTIIKAVN